MIYVHSDPHFFEIHTAQSVYACGVDENQRLQFRGWSARPPEWDGPLYSKERPFTLHECTSQDCNKGTDEVIGYGDEVAHEPSISLHIPEGNLGPTDAKNFPVRDLRLRYKGYRIGTPSQPYAGKPTHDRPTQDRTNGDWLILELSDAVYPFEVELCLRAHEDSDVIERYLVLKNQGPQILTIQHAWAASVQLPVGRYQATHLYGAWGAEFQQQRQTLPIGSTILESRELITSSRHQPLLFLQPEGEATRRTGETYVAQLAWSGNWRIHAEVRFDRSLRIHLGEHPVDSRFELAPSHMQATPLVLTSRTENGEEGAARNLRRYHQSQTLPLHNGPRPVLYNSWEATYFDLSFDGQLELAKKAAEVGCELFVVDDGWFGGRRHPAAGLGDWMVSSDVFPNGIRPLIDAVHNLGMKFGLWFEPEMVNPDSDLYRAHPDWVLHYPARERPTAREQLILDFGNPEVVENIRAQLTAILDENPIDFIKWDMNRTPNPTGSKAGEGIWRAHVEAVHGLMDDLLSRYPCLTIQSCASGGARVDAAMLARCCQAWTSDGTDALHRVMIQEGFILGYPAETMECWVTHAHNHQTGRDLPLSLRFAAAMRGVLGIGSLLNELPDDELAEYIRMIAFYKTIRPLVQGGILHRPALPELDNGLSAWQFTSKNGNEAYLSIIQLDHFAAQTPTHLKLKDLHPTTHYRLTDDHGEEFLEATGAELMYIGFQPIPINERHTPSYSGFVRHLRVRTSFKSPSE